MIKRTEDWKTDCSVALPIFPTNQGQVYQQKVRRTSSFAMYVTNMAKTISSQEPKAQNQSSSLYISWLRNIFIEF
jgi:hypothetical protein